MKNTLMCLLAALLLAFCLTACGGGQTTGNVDDYGSTGQAGSAAGGSVTGGSTAGSGSAGSAGSGESYGSGSVNGGSAGNGVMDDARDALDDAGRSVRGALDDAGNAMDRAF